LRTGALHAYAGPATDSVPASSRDIQAAESLGALVIVRLNRNSPLAGDDATACAAVSEMRFTARATGRFPIEEHRPNARGGHHGEAPLVRIEVRPR
jgi:hypothetical protein